MTASVDNTDVVAPPRDMDETPVGTPHSSAVYSTASTAALTLDALSRQASFTTLDDDMDQQNQHFQHIQHSQQYQQNQQNQQRPSMHRVASEQLLATPSDLTARALLATNAARATSMIVGKVTSRRRQRNPRRFVVTELPDADEFLHEPTSPNDNGTNGNAHDDENGATERLSGDTSSAAAKPSRPSKMEVRGRFTIIDLSPDSPATAAQGDSNKAVEQMELPRPIRSLNGTANGAGAVSRMRRAMPPRRFSRSEKSPSPALPESSVLTAAMLRSQDGDHAPATVLHNGNGHSGTFDTNGHHSYGSQQYSPKTPQLSPHGVDLNALDRHLVFLQQESLDMKAVLESMISSNARWITALSSSADSNVGSGKNSKAVHPAASPLRPPTPPAVHEPTLEEKYEKLLAAHTELQQSHEKLTSEAAQLKRTNLLLETRLRQETSVNEELRAHVDQLTQYTESLIYSAGEPPPRSERQRRVESTSSSASETPTESNGNDKLPPEPEDPIADSSVPPKSQNKHHARTVSEVSIDSSATWALENNQSGFEDDDESNIDSDDLDPRDARAIKAVRRRRWRNVSRSTSMSLDDDSASYCSSSYRDSWVSLFDPQHSTSATSDWRAMSYDGAESSVDDTLFGDATKPRGSRRGSVESSFSAAELPPNNQIEEGEEEEPKLAGAVATETETWARRRKSSAMIVEELEANPATKDTPNPAASG